MLLILDNTAIVIEGAMGLHNFIVDYRESRKDIDEEVETILEIHIFEQGLDDNIIAPIIVGDSVG